MKRVLVVTVALTLILSVCAFAGNNPEAKVAVHLQDAGSVSKCAKVPTIADCGDIITTHPATSVDAFPVFFDLVEYQGFDYGMSWPGLYTTVFTSCSDLTIGGIVATGDGVSHAWTACQYGTVAMPGWAWIYDYGIVCVVPHPEAGGPTIGDCRGGLDGVICNFCAGIGGYIGDDPCLPTATEPSTWGGIKGMFK